MDEIKNITVIGAGIMGAGIAQSIFKYGFNVTLYDIRGDEVDKAVNTIKSKARRNMDPEKIHGEHNLDKALASCDLLIEAIFEDLKIKCDLFEKLGKVADKHTIFATNTSSLSISAMAEASGRADRFLGLHFFNPPLIMRLVEVISQSKLDPTVLDNVKAFIKGIKKQGVYCKESPGFIVNRILLPVINEAFYILENRINEGMDTIEAANLIDSKITEEEILLMGPYDLADLTGLDTIYHVSDIIYEGFDRNPRYKRAPLLEEHFNAGQLGRKSRRGIYFYDNEENDPDMNPRLNSKGEPVTSSSGVSRIATTAYFDTLDFISVIVNEAFRVVEEGIVSDYNDIELAMELGTRWPKGPFRMAKEIGPTKVLKHLKELYNRSGQNPRYEPSGLFDNFPEDVNKYFTGG